LEDWFTVLLVVEWCNNTIAMMRRAVNQVLEERRVGGNVNNGIRRGNQSRHVEIESNEGAGTGQQRTGTKNVKRNNWKSHLEMHSRSSSF